MVSDSSVEDGLVRDRWRRSQEIFRKDSYFEKKRKLVLSAPMETLKKSESLGSQGWENKCPSV